MMFFISLLIGLGLISSIVMIALCKAAARADAAMRQQIINRSAK